MMKAFQVVFEEGPSRFARWTLSPFLILMMVFFASIGIAGDSAKTHQSFLIIVSLEVLFLASLLALWGVPHVIRIVTGAVAFASGSLLFEQALATPNPLKSEGSDLERSLMAFVAFGLPCAFYTVFGRFRLKKNEEQS